MSSKHLPVCLPFETPSYRSSEVPIGPTRRQWLLSMLFGGGMLGVRALVSGIPRHALANPRGLLDLDDGTVRAAIEATEQAQFLILSSSDAGEPFNCNVPGMYGDPAIAHPTADAMAPTTYNLGSQRVIAARPHAMLAPQLLARANYFHYQTGNQQHGGMPTVHKLGGAVAQGEMMVSAFGTILQKPLGCLQAQPISVGNNGAETLSFGGARLPVFKPTALRDLLLTPTNLASFDATQELRDRDLDALNALLQADGTPMQRKLLDAWATSQQQARALPKAIVGQLSGLKDNGVDAQMRAAVLVVQLKLSPVVVAHIPFGGDNHVDNDAHDGPGALPGEAAEQVAGLATINTLGSALASATLSDAVTFTTLSTFGRGNAPDLMGRGHNGLHACSLTIGTHVAPGVIGGAQVTKDGFSAQSIDVVSGRPGGSLTGEATLRAFGATLGRSLGISASQLATTIPRGEVVQAALNA